MYHRPLPSEQEIIEQERMLAQFVMEPPARPASNLQMFYSLPTLVKHLAFIFDNRVKGVLE
jgi:hypothetical protein